MNQRELGKSGVMVSEISFGCWTMGGLNWVNGTPNGWADPDEQEILAGIKVAIDAGVNHFDNADVYGNGKAERMLSWAFAELGVNSNDFVIATKIGHFPGTAKHAYEPAHIRHQCEQSLINLKRDHIDLYYFHHGDFGPSAMYLEDAAAVMNELVSEGKVRVKGQSAYSVADFAQACPVVQPDVLQSWAHALDDQFVRPGSPLQNLMSERNMSFVAFSPLAQGLLLDKFDPANPPTFEEGDHRRGRDKFGTEALLALRPKLAKLKERFGSDTQDLVRVALGYLLAMPNVACVIPGFRNAKQATMNVGGAGSTLSESDVEFVRQALAD